MVSQSQTLLTKYIDNSVVRAITYEATRIKGIIMNTSNNNITFKGNKIAVRGAAVKVGDPLPAFKLTGGDLQDIDNSRYKGKLLVISVVPSVDTPVCAIQTKRFNQEAGKLSPEVKILTVSVDLPFAQKRFCAAEGVENIEMASDFKYHRFGESFGVELPDLGLLARAIFISDKAGKIIHVEYVSEIADEPDYDSVINVLKSVSQ